MATPPTPQEGASQTRPPLFNGKYYGWWKNRIMDHVIVENPDPWGVIVDGPTIPMKTATDGITKIPKERKEWNAEDKLAIQNNAKAKKIMICGIGPDEYNRISSCQDAKAIWETLQTTHEGTTQVKKSKIDNLNRQYELFRMAEGETIQDMHIRFTSIINEMYSLGEIVPNGKAVRKLLSVLPETWESKVEAITEARDLDSLAMDELIGNLITYELKKSQEKEIGGKRKERNLVLKATASDDFEDENIALITKRFTKMLKRGQAFQKKIPQKSNENTKAQVCHKCRSPDHFIKFCPLWALEQKKTNSEKGKDIKKDKFFPSNRRMTTQEADISMKRAFAAMGNSSDEESEDDETENKSLLALEQEDEYDFLALVAVETKEEKETCISQKNILALMAGSDSEEDKEEEDMNEKGSVRRKQQQWYLDSACSRHMTGDKRSFLSLKNIKGGNVAFGNGKSGETQGIGKVGSMDTHAIENVYYVNGLQHNLLSVYQICDKGNYVLFTEKECRVTNSVTGNLVLLGKRHKNVYKAKTVDSIEDTLKCLSAISDCSMLWHKRMGH
ncbi:uncharacterized protein LOC107019261 [Solanum pennellii]|uniref:Uncharacterized protein LOC107019261 n=1 Tax=Solanum pennellii TaxID=28526 RepID=A0ABM1GSL5_SOLPN|nr:uncharacterized protein LOC107019261 [Solanum pennellii]